MKRRVITKAKVNPSDFELLNSQFLNDVTAVIHMEEIPPEIVINWDHTGLNYITVSNWTMAPEGSKRVEIFGNNDKRQIPAVFAGTMAGEFLYPQVIYAGKTLRCLPKVTFPTG